MRSMFSFVQHPCAIMGEPSATGGERSLDCVCTCAFARRRWASAHCLCTCARLGVFARLWIFVKGCGEHKAGAGTRASCVKVGWWMGACTRLILLTLQIARQCGAVTEALKNRPISMNKTRARVCGTQAHVSVTMLCGVFVMHSQCRRVLYTIYWWILCEIFGCSTVKWDGCARFVCSKKKKDEERIGKPTPELLSRRRKYDVFNMLYM